MAASTPNPNDVFDVKKVRRLVELMREFDLSVLDLTQGDQRIRLRRGAEPMVTSSGAPVPIVSSPAAAMATSAAAVSAPKPAADDSGQTVLIKSPMVGTFYTSPSPEAPPFVKVGDRVGPDTVVCIVEAMKVFNEIPAEISGTIAAVLVNRGDPVEFGQPLFKVSVAK
jgi:acetyl-CoA carboxylase biotin carboxyl carrier protein